MSRIKSVPVENATGQTAQLYSAIKSQLGGVPNLFQALGASPKILEAFLGLGPSAVSLSVKEKGAIALIAAQTNQCDYCLAAHTVLGKMGGFSESEMLSLRKAESADSKLDALIKFSKEVISERGSISEQTIKKLKAAGYSDAQVPEILMVITLNIFTNYFNRLNQTEIDFPKAPTV